MKLAAILLIALATCARAADLPRPVDPPNSTKTAKTSNYKDWWLYALDQNRISTAKDAQIATLQQQLDAAQITKAQFDAAIARIEGKIDALPEGATVPAPDFFTSYPLGQQFEFTVDVAPDVSQLATIELYANTTKIGSVSATPWTMSATFSTAGDYTLTLVEVLKDGSRSTSPSVKIRIIPKS